MMLRTSPQTVPHRVPSTGQLVGALLVALALCSLSGPVFGQSSTGNLLLNPSFESGITGWTTVASTSTVTSYGTANSPSNAVSSAIGGGGLFLRDLGGSSTVVEQVVVTGLLPAGSHVRAGGYFGGSNTDDSRLVVRFLDGAGVELGRQNLDYVTQQDRNLETVLMRREGVFPILPGTQRLAARIEFRNNCCSVVAGAADLISLEVLDGPVPSPVQPIGAELLLNGTFEGGWAPGSPLNLTALQSWRGVNSDSVVVKAYSDFDPNVPSTQVSCLIGGGLAGQSCVPGGAGNLLGHNSGNGSISQRIDLRGNAASPGGFSGLVLEVGAFLGGVSVREDTARIEVRFLNASLNTISPLPPVGPVSLLERNWETVLLSRGRLYLIPPQAAFVEVEVAFSDACCSGAFGYADNVSAKLTPQIALVPVPLNNIANGNSSFEEGSLPGSPLVLTDPAGWFGFQGEGANVVAYGSSSSAPSTSFAVANGLGGLLLRDAVEDGGLRQVIDLSGLEPIVAANRLRANVSAWLGGVATFQDTAEVRLRFVNGIGGQVGGASGLTTLGPVTAADRANVTTLLQRTADVAVPTGAARIELEVLFTDVCCSGAFGLADAVQVVLYDTITGGPVKFPGTSEDVRLSSGINGVPTTGPGLDVKDATAPAVLSLRIDSPGSTYDFQPIVLGYSAYVTGSNPTFVVPFPGIALDALNLNFLAFGAGCVGFGCAQVLPGGTQYQYALPPGLVGLTFRFQALVLPIGGPVPANGIFAATEAHEIRIL